MSDDAKPDYTTMSGAEFKRAAGIDPEKWAEAFKQACAKGEVDLPFQEEHEQIARIAAWFRDAMEAAVKHAVAPRWDQQYSDADLEAAAKQAAPAWDKLNKSSE